MNNKGQSLVLFVLLLPIMIGIIALVFDVSMIINQKQEQESVLEMTLQYSLEEENIEKEQIEELINKNLENANVEVTFKEESIYIEVQDEVDGIFSKLLGFSKFQIKSKYQGYIEQEKKKIEKLA